MIGKTERVILVKGDATKWYDQAIFIVNPNIDAGQMPVDFVAEAEKIISDYNLMRKNKIVGNTPAIIVPPAKRKEENNFIAPNSKKSRTNFALGFLMIVACLIITAIFAFGIMN